MIDLYIHDTRISMTETFCDAIAIAKGGKGDLEAIVKRFHMLDAYIGIFEMMRTLGYKDIDWEKGVQDEIYSISNAKNIPELEPFRERILAQHQEILGKHKNKD